MVESSKVGFTDTTLTTFGDFSTDQIFQQVPGALFISYHDALLV